MDKNTLEERAAFRLRERHLWPAQFREGRRSMRIEWERVQKMLEQLPIEDLPEFAQQWLWTVERTTAPDLAYHLRRGDFPYFDAWAHRMHILDETLLELGYTLPVRTPIVYAGYVLGGLSRTAEACFYDAGGPLRFESAFSRRAQAPPAEDDADAPPR